MYGTFQISVDSCYVPVGGRGGGEGRERGGLEKGVGGARERGIESILVLRGDYP
jgi:hypothetical protein